MKTLTYKKQRGVASLLTAVVLLTCITLVALFTSKTVVTETKMTANDYRTAQATAAAQAAMDQATAYFLAAGATNPAGGVDQYTNNTTSPFAVTTTAGTDSNLSSCTTSFCYNADYNSASPMNITLTSGSQTTTGSFYFVNTPLYGTVANPCDCSTHDCFNSYPTDKALIVAQGRSDDGSAVHTLTQCVGSFNILTTDPTTGNSGVPSPVVSLSGIQLNGNGTLVNRFTKSNVWSASTSYSIAGSSQATYLRLSQYQVSDLTLDQLIAAIPSNGTPDAYTERGSNGSTGNGIDIIIGDNTLAQLTFQQLFSSNIFNTAALAEAAGHCYSAGPTITITDPDTGTQKTQPCTGGSSIPAGTSGLVFADTGISIPQLGTATGPSGTAYDAQSVVLVVNGAVTIGSDLYGFAYSTGSMTLHGSVKVTGSLLAGCIRNPTTGVCSSSTAVTSDGASQLIYRPMGGNMLDKNGKNTGYNLSSFLTKGVVSGSWKDW